MFYHRKNDFIFILNFLLLFIHFWPLKLFINATHIIPTLPSKTIITTTTITTSAPVKHVISFVNQKKANILDNNNYEIFNNSTLIEDNQEMKFRKNLSYHANIIRLALKRLRLPIEDFEKNILEKQIQDDSYDDIKNLSEKNSLHKLMRNNNNNNNHNNNHNNNNNNNNNNNERPSFGNNFWHHARSRLQTLEPIRNLLNTIRDRIHNGNRSVALTPQYHHKKTSNSMHLLNPHQNQNSDKNNEYGHDEYHESAIETENERIMINESTGFHVLELIGTIVGLAWGLLTNLQGVFAASSGSLSGASSAGESSHNSADNDSN